MRQIAFYGKGGIGKSTLTSNVSAALAEMGYKVMQIGCDPKADSTRNLVGGMDTPTILDLLRERGVNSGFSVNRRNAISLDDIVVEGYKGVICCEAGGPEPGIGCAGRGIITAIQLLNDFGAFEEYKPDFVFYDVLGDVVCGGFAVPIREGFAREIFTITSAESMSIYACNNILKGIKKFADKGTARVSGVVLNSRNTIKETELLEDFCEKTKTSLFYTVKRATAVQECELKGMTVIEGAPDSEQADVFRALANKIIQCESRLIPEPFGRQEFYDWIKTHHELKG